MITFSFFQLKELRTCVCFSLNEINKTEKTREREVSEQKRIGKRRAYVVKCVARATCWERTLNYFSICFGNPQITQNERFKRLLTGNRRKIFSEEFKIFRRKFFIYKIQFLIFMLDECMDNGHSFLISACENCRLALLKHENFSHRTRNNF